MKYLRVTAAPDLDAAPEIFRLLAASSAADESQLLGWNFADSRGATLLFAVRGDCEAFTGGLDDAPEVVETDVTPDGERRFYLLVTIRPEAAPLFGAIFEALTRDGLLVLTPVWYREGEVHARVVGRSDVVQAVLDSIPPAIQVDIHEVGERGFEHTSPAAALSQRQREAVRAAIELGYYELPRQVTYEDIADRLGCAPSTASEHLQKAEAKIVRAAMTAAGSGPGG